MWYADFRQQILDIDWEETFYLINNILDRILCGLYRLSDSVLDAVPRR